MQGKVGISQSHSCASHSASLAAVCRCWLFRGSCSDPAAIGKCVSAQQCSVAELWAAAYFLYVCVYLLLLGPPLGFQCRLFLIPWEQAIMETHSGLRYKSLWMLTAWRKMLDFAPLPCLLSPMHIFLRKAGDFCGVCSQVHLGCVSQPGSAAVLGGL